MTKSDKNVNDVALKTISLQDLPVLPADYDATVAAATSVRRRFPEANRAEGLAALREIAERGKANPNELGDLGPVPSDCAELAATIDQATMLMARLEALLNYVSALRAVKEDTASRAIDDAYEQAKARIDRGKLPPESYTNVRAFVQARSQAVAEGIARAKAIKKEGEPK